MGRKSFETNRRELIQLIQSELLPIFLDAELIHDSHGEGASLKDRRELRTEMETAFTDCRKKLTTHSKEIETISWFANPDDFTIKPLLVNRLFEGLTESEREAIEYLAAATAFGLDLLFADPAIPDSHIVPIPIAVEIAFRDAQWSSRLMSVNNDLLRYFSHDTQFDVSESKDPWVGTDAVAKRLAVGTRQAGRICEGDLSGKKRNGKWCVRNSTLEAYASRRKKGGN